MENEQLILAMSDMMDKKLAENLAPIHARLDKMESRMDKMESQISSLKAGQIEIRKEIKEVNIRVSDTYQLALEAWGTSTENRHWLEHGRSTG